MKVNLYLEYFHSIKATWVDVVEWILLICIVMDVFLKLLGQKLVRKKLLFVKTDLKYLKYRTFSIMFGILWI